MSEKFCLRWNDFETNVSQAFGQLRNEEYLHDVTLVCDDNKQVSAHRLVLSVCSEFFKTLFEKNKTHPNPLICLVGINSGELQNILDYMYNGETKIFQENIHQFLFTAKRFQIKGLLQDATETNKDLNSVKTEEVPDQFEEDATFNQFNTVLNERWNFNAEGVKDVNEQTDEFIETLSDGSLRCTQCGKIISKGKSFSRRNMRNHVETHIEGLAFSCPACDKTFRSKNALNIHKTRHHR